MKLTVRYPGNGQLTPEEVHITHKGRRYKSTRVLPFRASSKTMALAFVIQGDRAWMGNDTYVEPSSSNFRLGAFAALPASIDAIVATTTPGSTTTLVTFAGAAPTVRVPMGAASALTGAHLGPQDEYTDGRAPLFGAIELATRALVAASASWRVLVIIGDGGASGNASRKELRAAVSQLKRAGVESYSIFYQPPAGKFHPSAVEVLASLGYSKSYVARDREQIFGQARALAARLRGTYLVTFELPSEARWQGTLVVKDQSKEIDFARVVQLPGDETDLEQELPPLPAPIPLPLSTKNVARRLLRAFSAQRWGEAMKVCIFAKELANQKKVTATEREQLFGVCTLVACQLKSPKAQEFYAGVVDPQRRASVGKACWQQYVALPGVETPAPRSVSKLKKVAQRYSLVQRALLHDDVAAAAKLCVGFARRQRRIPEVAFACAMAACRSKKPRPAKGFGRWVRTEPLRSHLIGVCEENGISL